MRPKQKPKPDLIAEQLDEIKAQRDELLAFVRASHHMYTCDNGNKTGYDFDRNNPPYFGTDEAGVVHRTDPYRYGCTCGLWALLAKFKGVEIVEPT